MQEDRPRRLGLYLKAMTHHTQTTTRGLRKQQKYRKLYDWFDNCCLRRFWFHGIKLLAVYAEIAFMPLSWVAHTSLYSLERYALNSNPAGVSSFTAKLVLYMRGWYPNAGYSARVTCEWHFSIYERSRYVGAVHVNCGLPFIRGQQKPCITWIDVQQWALQI